MSIMLPTIFSLGIHGLDSRAKRASSFIVMAIMGGAIMPKLMGHIADTDKNGMSAGFIVRLACFVFVTLYAFFWKKLSGTEGVIGADVHRGHGVSITKRDAVGNFPSSAAAFAGPSMYSLRRVKSKFLL